MNSAPDHLQNKIPEDLEQNPDRTANHENSGAAETAVDDETDSPPGSGAAEDKPKNTSAPEENKKPDKDAGSTTSEHDGKYFVIQKGKAQCNQGMSFPNFKVSSHQKHYWNDKEGDADYLAVTEDDLQFNPVVQPFGAQCKLQPNGSSYLPCSYAPAGKWQKTYEKVKVMGKSCLTELSELQCVIGGKITVMKHGQQSEAGKSHVKKSEAREQHVYNPIMDFEEFQDEVNAGEAEAW